MNPNPNAHWRDLAHLWIEGKALDVKVCFTCVNWEPDNDGAVPLLGHCRSQPPKLPRMGGFGVWPRTRRYDFCGEHKGSIDD